MPTSVEKDVYGTTVKGDIVLRYRLKNASGVVVEIIDYGAIVTAILVPDKNGTLDDVTTGFDTLTEYECNPAYFGAVVGRVANRIHKGSFTIDGVDYQVAANRPPNHLHGGICGFDKKVWSCQVESDGRLVMTLTSDDGDEGYPGKLTVDVTYQLTDDNELSINYAATVADKPTIVNLTNHAYFNLAGHQASDIYDHEISVAADSYLPKSDEAIPTGEIASVDGTPFDLRAPVTLGSRITQVEGAPGVQGIDHNFCLSPSGDGAVARVVHRPSGRVLEVFTDQPGLQVYTGNHLEELPGKQGAVYKQHSCVALETQKYPDAVHHDNFPSFVVRPGDTYRHRCVYKFSVLQ